MKNLLMGTLFAFAMIVTTGCYGTASSATAPKASGMGVGKCGDGMQGKCGTGKCGTQIKDKGMKCGTGKCGSAKNAAGS